MIRLDKYLAEMGAGSRAEVKKAIRSGLVMVDGCVEKKPERKIAIEGETSSEVIFKGEKVGYTPFEYYMLNKPAGVVSATKDDKDRTVLDLLVTKKRKDLFPVGRLDKDTEGLLLITNDGEMAHRLLSPKKHVDKTYYARVKGNVTKADKEAFHRGVDIGEEKLTLPSELNILEAGDISQIELTICEGKFHQVKRMFEAVGKEVIYLKRLSMGSLKLDEALKTGEYRSLTEEEVKRLC